MYEIHVRVIYVDFLTAAKRNHSSYSHLQRYEEIRDGGVDLPHRSQRADGSTGPLSLLATAEEVERRAPHRFILCRQ